MRNYEQIFKRKSFHLFRGAGKLTNDDLKGLEEFIKTVKPLDLDIRTEIRIVSEKETSCMRGGEYCILFYSEKKGDYLHNIGYMGQQIDLYCSSVNIGALWYGIGWPKVKKVNDLDYVIMIAIARMPEDSFRKDMFKSKRKPLEESWCGETLGVAEIARFAPSACNSQPWFVENADNELKVYRCRPKNRGIMPANKVNYYNRIDIGIFLFILEVCLEHEGIQTERILHEDTADERPDKTLVAEYKF